MSRTILSLAIVAILLGVPVGASDTRTLTGSFEWSGGGATGDLRAVFTPTGDNKWDVSFHFNFRDKDHVYSGTAEGNLTDGELKGTVQNESKSRTWTFSGALEDGTFRGTHAEIEDGKPQETGTLSLAG